MKNRDSTAPSTIPSRWLIVLLCLGHVLWYNLVHSHRHAVQTVSPWHEDLIGRRRFMSAKRQHKAPTLSPEAFAKAFYGSPVPVAIATLPDGSFVEANESFLRLFEYTREEVIGSTSAELNLYEDPEDRLTVFRLLQQYKTVRNFEWLGRTKTGKQVALLFSGDTVTIDGRDHVVATAVDVTEHRRAEEELRASEKRMSRTQEIALIGSWELDVVANRLSWSDQVYRIFGLRPQEFGATYEAFLDAVHPEDRAAVDGAYYGSLREGRDTYEIEHRVVRKSDGEIRIVHEKCEHVRDDSGRIVRSIGMVHDITERKEAEQRLQESEAMLERAQQMAHVGHWERNFSTGKVRWSDEIYRIFGLNAQECEVHGRFFFDHIHPEDRARVERAIRDAAEGIRPYDEVYRPVRPDGSIRWVHAKGEVARTGDGTPLRMFGTMLDITERKQLEDALRSGEETAQAILNASQDLIFLIDTAGFVLAANTAATSRLGAGIVGRCIHDLLLPAEVAQTRKAYAEQVVRTRRSISFEDARAGTSFFTVLYPILNDAGEVTRLVVYATDITERKKMEEELRRSRHELEQRVQERTEALRQSEGIARAQLAEIEAYYNMAPVGLAILDRDLRYMRINDRLAEMNGLPPLAHLGRTVREVIPKLADQIEELTRSIFETGRPVKDINVIGETHAKPGTERTWRATYFPLEDAAGEIVGIGAIAEEITEQRRLEEQLRQSDKMAAIGALAGGIAHDFNNMLAVIIGHAELALEDIHEGASESGYRVEQILKASHRATDLVRHILTFCRKGKLQQQPLKLSPLVKETVKLLRGSLLSTIRIKLDLKTDEDTVYADPTQVQQIIMNLATNAADAMGIDGGTLTIGLTLVKFNESDPMPLAGMQPGSYLRLSVQDTGVGIPRELRERIFEPFFTTKRPGLGTGMGLAVVYGIVRSHGGAVTVETEVGKGSTFTVFLPAIDNAAEGARSEDATPGGTERVLVVDDEPLLVESASETLRRLGYRVTTARSGSEGWEKFLNDPHGFDLVLTDHVMPDITGLKLAGKMLQVRADIPIILFTGNDVAVSAEEAQAAGIGEFLMKPLTKKQLGTAARRVLDSRNRGSLE